MEQSGSIKIVQYHFEHQELIAQILSNVGWEQQYITGQLNAVQTFADDTTNSRVYVAYLADILSGYISIKFSEWNRLAQIHGLVVDPSARYRGIAARLIVQAEEFIIAKQGRGVYVDTPVTNTGAREFYIKQGYRQDYIMTAYYDTSLDGVTYLKLFENTL